MGRKEKVLLRRAETYNPVTISEIIRDGLREFGLGDRVRGRVTIKPNVVMAHHKVTPSAYTRPEFLDGLLTALETNAQPRDFRSPSPKNAARPSRRPGCSGGRAITGSAKSTASGSCRSKQARQKTVPLAKGKIHQRIRTAREIVDRDFLVYAPKLKTNVLAHGLTARPQAQHRHPLRRGEDVEPQLQPRREDRRPARGRAIPISSPPTPSKASYGGNHLTQHGRPLGVVIMATNPLAHDVVCAHILHLDPREDRPPGRCRSARLRLARPRRHRDRRRHHPRRDPREDDRLGDRASSASTTWTATSRS